MAKKIYKRTDIDSTIFQEMETTYPLKSELNGICYARDMDYVTIERELLNNPYLKELIRKKSANVWTVYLMLREKMCANGWFVCVDNISFTDLTEKLYFWGVKQEEISPIIDDLIAQKLLYNVTNPADGKPYLICAQQLYNWEMLQSKRDVERKKKRKMPNAESQISTTNTHMNEPISAIDFNAAFGNDTNPFD